MPYEWNNCLVVTKDELVPDYFTPDNLSKNIQRYKRKPYGIKRVMIGGNGRQMLISYDSLPIEIQLGLGDPRKCDHILENFYKIDTDAVTFYSSEFKFPDGTYLDLEFQERYITNASVLKAIIALRSARETERQTKGGRISGILKTLVADAISFNNTLWAKHKVKHTLPPGEKQFKKVLNDFETLGYAGIISKKQKNANAVKVTDNTLELLNNIFSGQSHKPTATDVHSQYSAFLSGYLEVINNNTGELYNPKDFKKLSATTVKSYMAQWSNKIATYAKRSGNRQTLMGQFKPWHGFDKPKFAGSIISIDDRNPPFKMHNGKRMWFYNAYDVASEAFTCWVYGDTKEGIILEFYRQLVRNYAQWGVNLPAELECEMSLNSSFRDTFLKEGVMFEHIKMEANNARGKYIERVFGELRYQYEKQRKGWLARPNALSESNQPKTPIEKVPTLSKDEIVQGCLQDISDWNNEPHSEHKDKCRWEVFIENQHPELKPTNYIAILPHIGYKTQTSCNVGHIKLQGQYFLLADNGKVALGETLIQLMKQVEGNEIDVYWLDDLSGHVLKAFAFIGTQPICEIIKKPTYNRAKIERTGKDLKAQETISAYVASIDAYGRRQRQLLDPVTIINNTPKPKQVFVMPGLKQYAPVDTYEQPDILTDMAYSFEFETEYHSPKTQKDRF